MNQKERKYYEWGIVILLALLLGSVMMNRLAIVYLFPFIIPEFKMSYAQAGALTSILAITSAFATWFLGGLSDRMGRKIFLLPFTIFFSLMSWFSGLASSFLQIFFVRGLMGIGLGPILPASIATIAVESTPSRRGFNFGLHSSLPGVIAWGLGALLITQLTKIMSWRMVFFVVGFPGMILTLVLYFYMSEPKSTVGHLSGGIEKSGFFAPLRYRNVIISCITNILMMGCVFVFATFSVLYLTKEAYLTISEAGIIMSLFGFAGFLGHILLPLLSDYVGRRPVLIPSVFVTGLGFLGFILSGSSFLLLAISISIAGFAVGGVAPISLSALTTESVPPHMAAMAVAIPFSIGEILGSALMPFLAGYLCDLYGLKIALFFPVLACLIAGPVGFFYKETAPKIISRRITMTSPRST